MRHRYHVSLKANMYIVYTYLGCFCIYLKWELLYNSFKCDFSPFAKIKANWSCSVFCKHFSGIPRIQSLSLMKFEIRQVTVNSSTQLPTCFLTVSFPGHIIVYLMQLWAAVIQLLIVKFMLVTLFCGGGCTWMLCFLPVRCLGTNTRRECLLTAWWSALEWSWVCVPFTNTSSGYKISGFVVWLSFYFIYIFYTYIFSFLMLISYFWNIKKAL